jgi:sec-independent protein translocase protein TatB
VLDIGFGELIVIAVVALVVIGPERLPRVARTAGHLLGRFQRYVADVKADINREIELSELKNIKSSVEDAARSIENTVKTEMEHAGKELRSAEDELNKAGEALKKTGDEITSAVALPSPHMGMSPFDSPVGPVGAANPDPAGSSVPGALATATAVPPVVVADPRTGEAAASADLPEPSPQLELGLEPGQQSGGSAPQRPV